MTAQNGVVGSRLRGNRRVEPANALRSSVGGSGDAHLTFCFPLLHVMFPFDTQSPSDMLASHALYRDPSVAGDLACQSHLKRAYSYDKD
jgi:hypothetical protein